MEITIKDHLWIDITNSVQVKLDFVLSYFATILNNFLPASVQTHVGIVQLKQIILNIKIFIIKYRLSLFKGLEFKQLQNVVEIKPISPSPWWMLKILLFYFYLKIQFEECVAKSTNK